jgi:hypothetical protein
MQKGPVRFIALICALLGWFAVIVQLFLMIDNRGPSVSLSNVLFRFFGYFTIDTNILVALFFTFISLGEKYRLGRFFSKPSTVTALTVYITIVGIVYNVILRSLWEPTGLQKTVDELLHTVIPALVIIFWLAFVPIEQLKWKNVFGWLIYPIIYMIYVLIHGYSTKWYPYPFVDVNEIGYNKALINAGGVLLIIFLLSLALIATGQLMKKFDNKKEKVVS